MKKLILLAVLILAFSASIAVADNPPDSLNSTLGTARWAPTLISKVSAPNDTSDLYYYDYALQGAANFAGKFTSFSISIDSQIVLDDIFSLNQITLPSSGDWEVKKEDGKITWTSELGIGGRPPLNFGFASNYAQDYTVAEAIAKTVSVFKFEGKALGPVWSADAPTAVPEPSTLVGFGSALVMAGPGMIGYIRRRRS